MNIFTGSGLKGLFAFQSSFPFPSIYIFGGIPSLASPSFVSAEPLIGLFTFSETFGAINAQLVSFFIFSSLYLTFVYTLEFCNLGFVFVFFSVFVSVFVFLCHLYAPGDSATFSSKGSVSLFEILKGSSCA